MALGVVTDLKCWLLDTVEAFCDLELEVCVWRALAETSVVKVVFIAFRKCVWFLLQMFKHL